MRQTAIFLLILFVISVLVAIAQASIFECGHEDGDDKGIYPYEGPVILKTKVIYVGFPGGADSTLVPEFKAAVDTLKWYFDSHSHGILQYSEDSGIVLRPGESFDDPQNPPIAWMADLSASQYRAPFVPPANYAYTGLTESWYDTTWAGAALNAEILHKIMSAYPGSNEIFANTDRLVINYLTNSPGVFESGVGGRPMVYITPDSLPSPFFDFIGEESYSVVGSQQNVNFEDGADSWDAADIAYPMVHEAGHGLGPSDGPPNFVTHTLSSGRYYYGNLNLMDQRRSVGEGLPPIGLGWLQDIPWKEGGTTGVIDFTGQAFRDTVFDIRSPKGRIYKFRIESEMCLVPGAGDEQYFLIAYHAGKGIDGVVSTSGDTLMRSRGLEIMHCKGRLMFDLESAFGLFSNPSVNEFNMDSGCWTNMDTELGYDNHDYWDIESGNERNHGEYSDYIGAPFDFFRINFAGEDTVFNNAEFSYDSNPNCFGYGWGEGRVLRRFPQNVPNSMRVKILEQNDDEGWMIVDFSTAPFAELSYPDDTPGLAFSEGDTIDIRWSHDFGDGIDRIDVLFFPFNDEIPQVIASDFSVSSQNTVFPWVVGRENVTDGGKLKVVFKNPYTRYVTADSINVVIEGDIYPAETIITPTVGTEFFTGVVNQITWTKRFRSFPADTLLETLSVDLLFSAEGGAVGTWDTLAVGSTFYQEVATYNSYLWTPGQGMQTSNGMIKLVFHTKGDSTATDECDVAFPVFPLGAHFGDSTREVGDLESFRGEAYSGVSLDFDGDKDLDLFVSIDDPGSVNSGMPVLFKNRMPGYGGLPDFEDFTSQSFLPQPPALSHGVAMGDFDQDGDEDLFLTNENTAFLYRFESGVFEDVLATSFSSGLTDSLLENTSCATWVDYDHDGDLDLYLGRLVVEVGLGGEVNVSPLRDAVFQNQGPDSNYNFVEVGYQIGLVDSLVNGATKTVIWSDINKDHLWEVFIGDASSFGPQNLMFEQQPDGNFVKLTDPFPVTLGAIEAAKLVDVDNSGSFELVLKKPGKRLYILEDFQAGFTGHRVLDDYGVSNNLGILDFDLDSWVDFLLPGSKAMNNNTLWANLRGNSIFDETFINCSPKCGISVPQEDVGSLVIADFTGDGDPDIFLGTCMPSGSSTSDGRYFQNSATGGGDDAPANHWLGIRLANCEDDLATNLGAVVTAKRTLGGTILGMQQLDGGSGRGSQADRTLIFGLGSYGDSTGDDVALAIDWPNGESMDVQVFASQLDTFITITRITEFSIDTSSVKLKTYFDITQPGKLDFSFSWKTDGLTEKVLDEVQITPVSGSTCPFNSQTLTIDFPGVVVQKPKYKINAATGEAYYEHLLVWEDVDCLVGCSFQYSVFSSTGCRTDSYAKPRPFIVSVCPSSN